MDKAHEGSNACPRADHDYWVGGLEGQAELRLPYVHRNGGLVAVIRVQFVLQPVGGNSLVNASSLCFVFYHYCTDVDAIGVNLQKKKRKIMNRQILILRYGLTLSSLPTPTFFLNVAITNARFPDFEKIFRYFKILLQYL